MTLDSAALGFAALGAPPRLDVLRLLVRAGHSGLTVGQIQDRLSIPASTLAHHLRALSDAGLIEQVKQGRSVINIASFTRVQMLADYLTEECCLDEAATPQRAMTA